MDLETLLTLTEDLRLLVERAGSTGSGVAVIDGVKGVWRTKKKGGVHIFLPDDPCTPSPAPKKLWSKIKRRGSEKCGSPKKGADASKKGSDTPKLKKDAPPKVKKDLKKLLDTKNKTDDAS